MSFLWLGLGFLAGVLLGRRLGRSAAAPPRAARHEWAAFSQGSGPTMPDRRTEETPGRIYLHSPP